VDLRLFGRVLWRFRFVVGVGFLLAVSLAVFTIDKVDVSHGFPKLTPRTQPVYSSNATLLITQPGFPWGSAVQQYVPSSSGQSSVPVGDSNRLTGLAGLYVQLANSDVIRALIAKKAPRGGKILASQNYVFSPSYYSTALPIITITGLNTTRGTARATAQAGADALIGYLTDQQKAAGIRDSDRVVVQELARPRKTLVANGPKKTLPIAVFLTVMLAVSGFAFVLENLRPRTAVKAVVAAPAEPLLDSARRSA
jgi:hypothetical protein